MSTSYHEVSVKGRMIKVPAIRVEDNMVVIQGRVLKVAEIFDEYWLEKRHVPDPLKVIAELRASGHVPDLFTFSQRVPDTEPRYEFPMGWSNYAVIPLSTYDHWLKKQVASMTKRNIQSSGKRGVEVRDCAFDDDYVRGIMSIYNETAIRQGRKFWHYGKDFSSVQKENGTYAKRSLFLAAFFEGQMIGYMKIVLDEETAAIMQILSKMEFYDKRPNNALMAAGVRKCCSRGIKHLLYEKYVYEGKPDSSLTEYKRSSGFVRIDVPQYFVPLTAKGSLALRLGLNRNQKDKLPYWLTSRLIALRTKWYEHKMGKR